VVVEAAVTIKGSTARSASLCLLIGAASRDAPDRVDVPKPSLGNGNWEQTLFGVPKVSIVVILLILLASFNLFVSPSC
jgi:hypothetical protein